MSVKKGKMCLLGLVALSACLAVGNVVFCQEMILPLGENTALTNVPLPRKTAAKGTLLTLPFFEDFADESPYPNTDRWADQYVYVNNTFGYRPVSRGVATFDALDQYGALYAVNTDNYTRFDADTLTSLAIDLSSKTPSDSVYLSFFYQAKGYGFLPKSSDSLNLYFLKSNGVWQKIWSAAPPDSLQAFVQVMIPLTDTAFFNAGFQMRFINQATIGISNSNWNLDYIRLDEGRDYQDTALDDVAFTAQPTSILNDFTAMPFRHFKTNASSFLAANLTATLQNNGGVGQNLGVGYRASETLTNTDLGTITGTTALSAYGNNSLSFGLFAAGSYTPTNSNDRVVFEQQYFTASGYANEPTANDTINCYQEFDNYFAYDDGTAEQSYYLNLLSSAPGYTAVEYALYQPDTIRGVALRFARTNPEPTFKEFALAIYKSIAYGGASDQLVYQSDYIYPSFEDSINKFSVFAFDAPVVLEAGVFYVVLIQAAGGTSDSLQIALDANRTGGNHRYYKVENNWESSQLDGALLMRPLVGAALTLGISDALRHTIGWEVSPNPAKNIATVTLPEDKNGTYTISSIDGKTLSNGLVKNGTQINLSSLPAGLYVVRIAGNDWYATPKKLIKEY
ncbi:MAG: T9SS type A sorting domain-containing protein [Edaphocola sp.]